MFYYFDSGIIQTYRVIIKRGNSSLLFKRLINISSIGGIVGVAGTSPYTAAKGALRALTKLATVEYAKDLIRVNSVHPGIIETPMTASSMGQALSYFKTFAQLPYFGKPEGRGLRNTIFSIG